MAALIGHDDQALTRVPDHARHSWVSVATQRFGQMSTLSQLLLGATLGFGMSFWDAFLALTLGAVIIEVVAVVIGIIGQREGFSTSVLARWTGFGHGGSAVLGVVIAISTTGWFGIQTGIAGEALTRLVGVIPVYGWSLIFGLLVTLIATYGFRWMAWTAYLTVPAFLLLAGWTIAVELSRHDLGVLINEPAPGPRLGLLTATTLVAGSFIVGAAIAPDMTRFNRSSWDVVKQTVVGITLGEWVIGCTGVLLAHAVQSSDVISIVTSSAGWFGALVVVTAVVKINDWNLYAASLGLVNFFDAVFDRQVNRAYVSLVIGVAGTILATAGILGQFTDFLIVLGVVFPPIPGIMAAEYFVVRRWRNELSSTRPRVPRSAPSWVPATVVIWPVASMVGQYVDFGIPPINALFAAFILYVSAGRLDLIRCRCRRATNRKVVGETSAV